MPNLNTIGSDWIIGEVDGLTDHIDHVSPVQFNEDHRYIPDSETPLPGYMRFDVTPYLREIVECFSVESPVREVNLMKGVKTAYTTGVLESGLLYFIGHVKTLPIMLMTVDNDISKARIENNVIPMLNHSGFGDVIRSSDDTSRRKTGKTAKYLQFEGGGTLYPFGAQNAAKMRMYSICIMLKDEIDGWPDTVGKDGCPDKLSDDRCAAYWERRKIFRGSTPLIKGTSKIEPQYLRGDQRHYLVLCKKCGYPQKLKWITQKKSDGLVGGFQWDLEEGSGLLLPQSVRYCCQDCGHEHYEHDKQRLFSEEHGAHWHPTSKPVEPFIRSYHLPAMYSPIGMQPWSKNVASFLDCFDPVANKVISIPGYQVFKNNVLGETFEIMGARVRFASVSAHRRRVYRLGEIPNEYAVKYSGSHILFLTCQVDVHQRDLAVAVMGWTRDAKSYVIDYWRFEARKKGTKDKPNIYEDGKEWTGDDEKEYDCQELTCPAWGRLRSIIEEKEYTADDGKIYRIIMTTVDAGYANDTVTTFCSDYESGVYPTLGRDRPSKNQKIKEFSEFETQLKTVGYTIVVDHYKDRIAPVLRRDWHEDLGDQGQYHFNAPVDISDAQLRELTKESRKDKIDEKGTKTYFWYRKSGAKNELWDLLVYGHAAVEILAWLICVQKFELETIDYKAFWDYLEKENLYYT